MTINILVFDYELRQAGLTFIDGVSSSPSLDFPDCRIDWQLGHPTSDELITAQNVYVAHDPNKLLPWDQAAKDSVINYALLTIWVKTGTAVEAETYINSQIFNSQTQAQVDAYIDATIKNITTANVAQINAQLLNIRTVLKAASAAIITMRSLFIITAKLLIYIRDLVIRFRK